jgi:PAS domain S-box-containing protein
MLRFFRDVPIRRKLIVLLLLASVSGVVLTGLGLAGYAWTSRRAAMESDLALVSSIIASNATAALAFHDAVTANEILSAIQAKPDLETGCLYLGELGAAPRLFARYSITEVDCPTQPGAAGVRFEGGALVSVQPVAQAGERLGWLRLQASLEPLKRAIAVQGGIMLSIVGFSVLVSVGIAFAMQRAFAGPILRLAQAAREVSETRNYGLRVTVDSQDEVGGLAEDFNAMLGKIAQADFEIKRAGERIRLVVEAAPNAMLMVNADGQITLVNEQTERMFGYARDQLIAQPVEMLIPRRVRDHHPALRTHYFANPTTRSMGVGRDLYGVTKDGREVPIEIGLNPIRLPDGGDFVLASIIDITERKSAERAMRELNQSLEQQVSQTARSNQELAEALARLREAQMQLVQAEKMASLGALVAGIAHEINTPVGVGVTAASTLQARATELRAAYESQELRRSDLDRFVTLAEESSQIILRNLQRAADLIHSFKQVAVDQSSGERRSFKLRGYIEEILLSLRPKLKRTAHVVEVDCPDDLVVDSYPGAIAQVLTNLVTNSLLHAFEDNQPGHIRIAVRREAERVELAYSDDGRGIPAENLPSIFDPFFTTRRGTGGTGLGLHIVYNLVTQRLGGSIQVASEPGKGTRFTLLLPTRAQKAAA